MALLTMFNGGINTKMTPSLIQPNEGQIYKNIDNTSGSLKPIKAPSVSNLNQSTEGDSFIYFKGSWINKPNYISYVLFGDNLYYSGESSLKKTSDGITFNSVGITSPTNKLQVSPESNSDSSPIVSISSSLVTLDNIESREFMIGDYEFLIVANLDDEVITETHNVSVTNTDNNAIELSINVDDSIVESIIVYLLVDNEYKKFHWASSISSPNITLSGGIPFDFASIYTGSTSRFIPEESSVRQYCYTYYNSLTGTESAPSPLSDETNYYNGSVTLSGFIESTNIDVTNIRVYRIGGDLTEYNLVGTKSNDTSDFIDSKTDLDIAGIQILDTIDTIEPPSDLQHLVEYSSTLFGAKGSTLWFSMSGLVDMWSPYNFITLPEYIMGLGFTQNGLLIFTRNQTYILTGSSSSTFSKHLLHGSQGCVGHNSIAYVNNVLIWLSLDGVCVSDGSDIQIISRSKLKKLDYTTVRGVVYEDQYFLFHTEGCLVTDFREGLIFKDLDIIANGAYFSPIFDTLYIREPITGNMLIYEGSDDFMTYEYKSGRIPDGGLSLIKQYKHIYVSVEGTCTLSFYIDKKLVSTHELVNGFNNIKVPQQSRSGYYSEVYITGTGEVLEIEFKSEGRQNGR